MYGLVNNAFKELITKNYSEEIWALVQKKSGVSDDFFLTNVSYDDSITYSLVGALSEVTSTPVADILIGFGKHWILDTGAKMYGDMIQTLGNNVTDFLVNLVDFHKSVYLIFPKITPPEFKVTDITENELVFHYFSERQGLAPFVHGLILGVGIRFQTELFIKQTAFKSEGDHHDIFNVSWS